MNQATDTATTDSRWKNLYKITGMTTVVMVAIIPIQILVYTIYPPPDTVLGFFTLFQKSWLLGLLSMDLLYILNNMLLGLIYLALYLALKRHGESLMTIALMLGLLGIAAYFPSNTAFEMLSLSNQYAAAATETQRALFLSAGEAMLAIYIGTAFNVYYVLNAAALLIFAVMMLRSDVFSKATGYAGLIAGILMIIPSTAGTLGLIFALASLVPWTVFSVLIARRFFALS